MNALARKFEDISGGKDVEVRRFVNFIQGGKKTKHEDSITHLLNARPKWILPQTFDVMKPFLEKFRKLYTKVSSVVYFGMAYDIITPLLVFDFDVLYGVDVSVDVPYNAAVPCMYNDLPANCESISMIQLNRIGRVIEGMGGKVHSFVIDKTSAHKNTFSVCKSHTITMEFTFAGKKRKLVYSFWTDAHKNPPDVEFDAIIVSIGQTDEWLAKYMRKHNAKYVLDSPWEKRKEPFHITKPLATVYKLNHMFDDLNRTLDMKIPKKEIETFCTHVQDGLMLYELK